MQVDCSDCGVELGCTNQDVVKVLLLFDAGRVIVVSQPLLRSQLGHQPFLLPDFIEGRFQLVHRLNDLVPDTGLLDSIIEAFAHIFLQVMMAAESGRDQGLALQPCSLHVEHRFANLVLGIVLASCICLDCLVNVRHQIKALLFIRLRIPNRAADSLVARRSPLLLESLQVAQGRQVLVQPRDQLVQTEFRGVAQLHLLAPAIHDGLSQDLHRRSQIVD